MATGQSTELQFQSLVFSFYLSRLKDKVISWSRRYIFFSKPVFFLTGLLFAHGFVENAVMNQLMLYLKLSWRKDDLRKSAAIVNIQEGVTAIIGFVAAQIITSPSARFKMVIVTVPCYLLGLILLMWFSWDKWHFVAIFYPSLVLLSLGKVGKNPPLKLLLADQLLDKQSNEKIFDEHVQIRTENWWRVIKFSGAAVSALFVDIAWFPPVTMGVGYLMFVSGIYFCNYNKTTTFQSLLRMVCKVLKEALRKRKLDCPPRPSTDHLDNEASNKRPPFSPDISFLRWIDKAVDRSCSVRHNSQNNDCLVTVAEVKYTKRLLMLIPLWICVFMCSLIQATGSTFFVEQSDRMKEITVNRYIIIDISLMLLIQSMASSIISLLVDFLIPEDWRPELKKRATLVRIGVGLIFSACCCVAAWHVEAYRLQLVQWSKQLGEYDYGSDGDNKVPLRIWWLVPQFLLLGMMEGLVQDGLGELIKNVVDGELEFLEKPFNNLVEGVGKILAVFCAMGFRGLICDSIDDSRLDKYFKRLAVMSSVNVGAYCVVAFVYASFGSSEHDQLCQLNPLVKACLGYKSKEAPPEEDEPKEEQPEDAEVEQPSEQNQQPSSEVEDLEMMNHARKILNLFDDSE